MLVAVTLVLLAACGSDDDDNAPPSSPTPAPAATEAPPTTEAPIATEIPAATEVPPTTEEPDASSATEAPAAGEVSSEGPEVAPVLFDGFPAGVLPELGEGLPVPGIFGTAVDGTSFRWTPGTSPAAIVFLAHWCPACQAEVAELVGWLGEGHRLPEGVELFAVSTLVNPERDNYPPSLWLRDEGWPFPVLMDDTDATLATAFGLSGTPFWAFVAANGTLVSRGSGRISSDELPRLFDQLLVGGEG